LITDFIEYKIKTTAIKPIKHGRSFLHLKPEFIQLIVTIKKYVITITSKADKIAKQNMKNLKSN